MNSLTPACSFLSIGKHQFSKLAVCQRLSFGNVLLNLYLLKHFQYIVLLFKKSKWGLFQITTFIFWCESMLTQSKYRLLLFALFSLFACKRRKKIVSYEFLICLCQTYNLLHLMSTSLQRTITGIVEAELNARALINAIYNSFLKRVFPVSLTKDSKCQIA